MRHLLLRLPMDSTAPAEREPSRFQALRRGHTGLALPLHHFAAGVALWFALAPPLGASQDVAGKIQGRVTEAGSGRPIAGASVRVVGSPLHNLTDTDGFYFLNNVSAGLTNVRAEFIGYRPAVVEGERILAGQTTTLNFQLEETQIELEPIRVEGERTPLVPRDQTVSKSIVRGETVDLLPLDDVESIVRLQPGVSEVNCENRFLVLERCTSLRGGRPNEEVVFIDGVPIRAFGTGSAANLSVPTNALEQLDVTVGAFSAEFGEGQAGVVSYVTRRGGSRLEGSLEYTTDRLAPGSWRTYFDRVEGTLGGPVAGPVSFFVAGTATGQPAFVNEGSPDIWVIDGVDTCPDEPRYAGLCTPGEAATFTLPGAPAEGREVSEVEIRAPRFTRWEAGRSFPFNWQDEYLLTGNLNVDLPAGSRVTLSYTRNRAQAYGRSGGRAEYFDLYRTVNVDGFRSTKNALTLGGYFLFSRSASQQLAFDFRASYQRDRFRRGIVDHEWFLDNRGSVLGFTPSDVRFLVERMGFQPLGFDVFDPTDQLIDVVRSGAVPTDTFTVLPSRPDITFGSFSPPGAAENLRLTPYGLLQFVSGLGFFGLRASSEDRWLLRGSLDWQVGRFNRLKIGGEYARAVLRETDIPMHPIFGATTPERGTPIRVGAFVQNRLDLGDLVVEGGLRWDYLDPRVEFPRVPGFVSNVPDSLKAGFVRAVFGSPTRFVPAFDEPCGGVSDQNPNGTCLENFFPAASKAEVSPRIGVSFPVTATSTFRLSFGRFVQSPAFLTQAASGQAGLLHNNNLDEQRGGNRADLYARDVALPSTRLFEFGYRQLIGPDLVIDAVAFNKRQRNGLTFQPTPFENPNVSGLTVFRNVLTNGDFSETNGFEVKVDRAIGNAFVGSVSYSHLSARGSGSDPFTFVDFLLQGARNLQAITGQPPSPPNLIIRLDQSRRHNITLTSAVQLPPDLLRGSVAGALLGDLGFFMTLAVRSGLPFTKLENFGSGQIGPSPNSNFRGAPFSGTPETGINRLETPWTKSLDLRVTKRFRLAGLQLQLIADLRNPFGFSNTRQVFLETAATENSRFRDNFTRVDLADPTLDGDADIDGFDIRAEAVGSDLNKFMLLRAEERFGNGDGFYTVEEQKKAAFELYDAFFGRAQLVDSNQNLRLGLRISF